MALLCYCVEKSICLGSRLEAEVMAEEDMVKAAIKIQSRVRGQQAQQAVDAQKHMQETRRLLAEEQTAAVMIQAQIRGKRSRTDFFNAESERQAALSDTSWLDCEVGQWLTHHGEASIVHTIKAFGVSTLRDLVRSRAHFCRFRFWLPAPLMGCLLPE